MSIVYGTNTELLGTYSELWDFNKSYIVRTRRTLNGEKLLVDVTEIFSHETPSHIYAIKLARNAARRFGAESMDYGVLMPLRSTRKVSDATGTLHMVNIVRQTFVFTVAQQG
jgi:hypothetical protein